ncbi:HNH endonuclease signature motif containing protein [Galactobacter sp.]|uniref:HNH endonuclease signature motif containing protein n=1 Tax=Galactobacter sp. TaxID=2676125 RepID=UPI0025C47838|nr:HNH endonuclease signature motif containing protein [Galactobacter sp.]
MTITAETHAPFVAEMPEILGMLDIAASSNASATTMIQGFFGRDGSELQRQATGALVPEAEQNLSPTTRRPTIQDFRDVLSAVNTLSAEIDHLRTICAEIIMTGSDPFIEKPQRISDRLGERSPEATIKKYLLHSPKQLRDTKTVRTAITGGEGCSFSPMPPLLPVLATAVQDAALTLEQAEAIASALTPVARRKSGVDPEVLATVESILVGHATGGRIGTPPDTLDPSDLATGRYGVGMHPEELKRLGKQLAELIDQDGPEPADNEVQAKRSLTLKPGRKPGDPARLTATLTPEAYEQLTVLLSAILDPKTAAGAEPTAAGAEPTEGGTHPVLPFHVTDVDQVGHTFRFPDEDPVTFPQAQHDAFVTLLGLAAKTAPDQGGAPPRVILLARAEQVLKILNSQAIEELGLADSITLDRAGQVGRPGRVGHSGGRTADGDATTVVDRTVGRAIRTLLRTGEAGFLTDEAVAGVNGLIELLNREHFLRNDDPTQYLRKNSSGLRTNGPGPDQGEDSPDRCTPAPPFFGSSLLQDPRLLDSALLPATGETIPLSRLGTLLCSAITEIVATRRGDFLSYSVTERRTFTPAQRRVLLTTFTSCAVPDCHVPGLRCDAHHVQPAALDGPTTVSNGVLLCRHHHTKLHQGRLRLVPRQPGIPGLDATG